MSPPVITSNSFRICERRGFVFVLELGVGEGVLWKVERALSSVKCLVEFSFFFVRQSASPPLSEVPDSPAYLNQAVEHWLSLLTP